LYSKDLCRLGDGQIHEVHEFDRGALRLGEAGKGCVDIEPGLGRGVVISLGGHLGFSERNGWPRLTPANAIDAGVHHYSMQPRRHSSFAAVTTGMHKRGNQRLLHRVRGLLTVTQGTQGDCPQPVAVPACELAEGMGVAIDVRQHERPIVSVRSDPTARPRGGGPGPRIVHATVISETISR
jgi:hypothetical protein